MTDETKILTPENSSDHHTVGHKFKAWDGNTYFCDSYDPRIGYWMKQVDGERRTNVSERAIGRTFHIIHADGFCALSSA